MPSILLVPIRIDALNLQVDTPVLSPKANFSLLPYVETNGQGQNLEDRNPETAFISESITQHPFQDKNLILSKGIHLHWAMPDGLVHQPNNQNVFPNTNQSFPALPNRWLVSRKSATALEGFSWIVESDFLHPPNTDIALAQSYVSVPLNPENNPSPPFRYMGRQLKLADWKAETASTVKEYEYWEDVWNSPLTAIGYGEPTFASFYPNCRSVFGFFDELNTIPASGTEYQVFGWYNTQANDYLFQQIQAFQSQPLAIHKRDLDHWWQQLAKQTWLQLINKQWITPTAAQVAPKGYGSGNIRQALLNFLFPASIITLAKRNTNQSWELSTTIPTKVGLAADIMASLPSNLTRHNQIYLLPRKRLIDRYGDTTGNVIWQYVLNSTETAQITPNWLAFTTAFSPDSTKMGLSGTILNLVKSDISERLLFNPSSTFATITQTQFTQRFGNNSEWANLIQRQYLLPTQGTVNASASGTISIGQSYSFTSSNLPFLPTGQSTLSQSQVASYFASQANSIWTNMFNLTQTNQATYKLLLPNTATLNLKSTRPSLGLSNITDQEVIQRLFLITKAQLISQFNPEKGASIWTQLLEHKWITYLTGDTATINPTTSRSSTSLGSNISTADIQTIETLFAQKAGYNTLKNIYGDQTLTLWKALIAQAWLIPTQNANSKITNPKAFFAQVSNLDSLPTIDSNHQADITRFFTYQKNTGLYTMLQQKFNWHIGVSIKKSELVVVDETDRIPLWEELIAKKWILQIEPNEGIIEPQKSRQPLSITFRKYTDSIDYQCNEAIITEPIPQNMLLFGTATLIPSSSNENGNIVNETTSVTIANTGAEALSARLAHLINGNDKKVVEEQLEAIQYARRLEKGGIDVSATFKKLRHQQEFSSFQGTVLWTIRPDKTVNDPDANLQATLPLDVAHMLNELNLAQQAYQEALDEVQSLQEHLFADWYKYMIASYPPENILTTYPNIDTIKYYISRYIIGPLYQKINDTGQLVLSKEGHTVTQASAQIMQIEGQISTIVPENTRAGSLAIMINALIDRINTFNIAQLQEAKPKHYTLQWVPGPRYWQPTDPVVLLRGAAVTPSLRHYKDGQNREDKLLECPILESTMLSFPFSRTNLPTELLQNEVWAIEQMVKRRGLNYIGFNQVTEKPWNPFLLEWSVRFTSVNDPSSQEGTKTTFGYDPNFITNNYGLSQEHSSFIPLLGKANLSRYQSDYQGISPLTDSIPTGFRRRIEYFLEQYAKVDFAELQSAMEADKTNGTTTAITWLNTWESDHDQNNTFNQVLYNAFSAYYQLSLKPILSQALNGFNNALVMLRQTVQLPVADPLGFKEYQAFANKVKAFISTNNTLSPQPLDHFNPIRAGALNILRMRLVDTFGRTHKLNLTDLVTTNKMEFDSLSDTIQLEPRLAQPARLNFRWISADPEHQDMEMNDHPATTPICGWLIPNKLDDSILIYDNRGNLQGIINEAADWDNPPGGIAVAINDIANPHLQSLVTYITTKGASFLQDFLTTLDNSLEYINPQFEAEHQDISLLMGRPIALARVSVGFELKGLPSINHDWNIFRQDMKRAFNYKKSFNPNTLSNYISETRETFDFTKVNLPVRLGDFQQLNDGLIGYWKPLTISNAEQDYTGTIDITDLFFAPQTNTQVNVSDSNIKTGESEVFYLQLAIDDPTITLPILFNPTGSLHATSGILPTKTIDIPLEQYKSILQKIAITFLSSPILSSTSKLEVPLPIQPGYQWSWLSASLASASASPNWTETPVITQAAFAQQWNLSIAQTLWQYLQTEDIGWMTPNGQRATVLPSTARKATALTGIWTDLQRSISTFLSNLLPSTTQSQTLSLPQFIVAWQTYQSSLTGTTLDISALWNYLLSINWITQQTGYFRLNSTNMQTTTSFQGVWKGLEGLARASLRDAAWNLAPTNLNADLSSIPQLYSGWLKLSHTL